MRHLFKGKIHDLGADNTFNRDDEMTLWVRAAWGLDRNFMKTAQSFREAAEMVEDEARSKRAVEGNPFTRPWPTLCASKPEPPTPVHILRDEIRQTVRGYEIRFSDGVSVFVADAIHYKIGYSPSEAAAAVEAEAWRLHGTV